MIEGDRWLEGAIISTLAEKMFQDSGGGDKAYAWHVSPLVLLTAKDLLKVTNDPKAISAGGEAIRGYLEGVSVYFCG
jgi:hypothetical protein